MGRGHHAIHLHRVSLLTCSDGPAKHQEPFEESGGCCRQLGGSDDSSHIGLCASVPDSQAVADLCAVLVRAVGRYGAIALTVALGHAIKVAQAVEIAFPVALAFRISLSFTVTVNVAVQDSLRPG